MTDVDGKQGIPNKLGIAQIENTRQQEIETSQTSQAGSSRPCRPKRSGHTLKQTPSLSNSLANRLWPYHVLTIPSSCAIRSLELRMSWFLLDGMQRRADSSETYLTGSPWEIRPKSMTRRLRGREFESGQEDTGQRWGRVFRIPPVRETCRRGA